MKLMIIPQYSRPDKGDGGIRRVVEAQIKHLPKYGFEIVGRIVGADIVATHAAEIPDIPVGQPWVVHTHGLYWSDYNWPQWGSRVNAAVVEAFKRCDCVTAPSKWVAYALKRGMWLNPKVLYHGIEPELWEPGENKSYVIWNKARTDVISDPVPMNRLAELAPDILFLSTFGDAKNNVRITGKKPFEEAIEDIRNSAVYLATSRETMGIGTLEAMACGVPILGWKWGGQAEIVKHGETGWLSPVGDYKSLLKGLYWCLENREKIGKVARADVLNRFTWEKVMAGYAQLYQDVYDKQTEINQGPKVSIIVPCHNLAHVLPDMVHSVLDQTMSNWEMVIVDDVSQDNSHDIATEYASKDSRIKVIKLKENVKLPEALNIGFSYTRGRYVMNLDPDNMIPPNTLKILSDALDNSRSIHICYGRIKFVLEDGVTPDPITQTDDGVSAWPPEFSCLAQFKHRNQIPCNALMRREVYERTGGYRSRAKVSEDAEFWTRAVSYGFQPQKVTQSITLIYRYRSDSKSRDESEPDWTAWMPWTKNAKLIPWGVASPPPKEIGRMWPVPSCEPAQITVIIPVGSKHDKVVIDALDSVEAQTYRDWNCIVVNDTGKKLSVPHPWAKIIKTKGKEGPGAARNLGIAASKTRAFVCLDADDILEPDCLKEMWSVWRREGGIVYSQWFDDKGDGDITVWNPPEWEPTLLITDGCIFASCAMYDKKIWESVGGFDSSMQNWEDWDFQIAAASKGFCATKINMPLFTYRKTIGHRREESAANKSRGEEEMRRKWPDMWDSNGKEKLAMACGGCGKKRARPEPVRTAIPINIPTNGAVLLEYKGKAGKSMWIGKVTGKKYYFGNDHTHKRMFVYATDAEGFLNMNHLFELIKEAPKGEKSKPILAGVMEG